MKTALVCAIFFSQFAADGRDLTPVGAQRCRRCPSVIAVVPARCTSTAALPLPAPVAELTTGDGPTVGGVLLRVRTAPEPIRMLSPMAPPEYGSARSLLTYTDDPNRTDNPNVRHEPQPNGIRLLTLRPNW